MRVESTTVDEAEQPLYVGVDVGGTRIKIGLVDNRGRTVAYTSLVTEQERGPQDAIRRISSTVQELLQTHRLTLGPIAAIGLGTPGTMDIPAGMLLAPPNLPAWSNFPIRDALRQALDDKVVTFANDASAAACGEYWVGSGREFESMVMLTLGTGVGGGIIIDGRSLDGQHSHGSECGHIVVDTNPDAQICSCGQRGHLEAYASATSVVKRTQLALQQSADSSLHEHISTQQPLTSLMVAQEAERGDLLARQIVLETADYLAVGIATLMNVIDPAAIILGGAMDFGGHQTSIGQQFLSRIRHEVTKLAFPVPAAGVTIDFAVLGSDAGYIGAAGLARAQHPS